MPRTTTNAAPVATATADERRQPLSKLAICSIDVPSLRVTAQYNPSELVIEQPIGWTDHLPANNQKATGGWTEFSGMKPRTLKLELLFDGAEHDGLLADDADSIYVADAVLRLAELAAVRDPSAKQAELRRPHFCVVAWSDADQKGVAPFRCVIETLVTKYSMFARSGRVLRATCSVSLKEADRLDPATVRAGGK
jgi:hypothetical protein